VNYVHSKKKKLDSS